jgi:ATP-binding cassette subfamily B protein
VLGAAPLVAGHAVVLAAIGLAARDGRLSTAQEVVAIQLVLSHFGWGYLGDDEWRLHAGAQALIAAREFPEVPDVAPAAGTPPTGSAIELHDVEFTYPSRSEPALRGLSVSIPPGSTVALVGENGAGKSTLINLLCGLYVPSAGSLRLGGVEADEVDLAAWRARLAVVFQDYAQFAVSVADNVRLREWTPDGGPVDVPEGVASRSGLDRILAERGITWQTPLSSALAGGTDLSGGQWQRVALAAALHAVEGGADVVILDEPTAQLDPAAELDIIREIVALDDRVTKIVVSHRLPTVRLADRVIVMEGGRITGDGTHAELLQQNDYYRRFVELQRDLYLETT